MNWKDIIVAVIVWRVLDALFPETFLDRWGQALASKVRRRLGTTVEPEQIDGDDGG